MGKISPDEILLKHGKWISRAHFIKLICMKREVGERQAYNLLTASVKEKKIKKFFFQNGTTIYGLEEFGPPTQTGNSNANYLTSNWDLLLINAEKAGGSLIDVEFEKLELGDTQDPITGWYEKFYQRKKIQGILILSGAVDLQRAIGLVIPESYSAFLLTKESAEEGDRLRFKENHYEIKDVKEINEGINFSYNILKMVKILY